MVPPIVQASLQAAVLAATSNILAQTIRAYRDNEFLEQTFPGKVEATVSQKHMQPDRPGAQDIVSTVKSPDAQGKNVRESPPRTEKQLSVRNTFIKFLLDQTVGAMVNTVLFIGIMGALSGLPGAQVMHRIRSETLPLMVAGYKLWPLVSLLSFTVVPPNRRLVFGNLVGVAWGVFLSLFAAR